MPFVCTKAGREINQNFYLSAKEKKTKTHERKPNHFLFCSFWLCNSRSQHKHLARLGEGRRTGKGELNHFIHKIDLNQSCPSANSPHVKKERCVCIYVCVIMLVLLVICFRDSALTESSGSRFEHFEEGVYPELNF